MVPLSISAPVSTQVKKESVLTSGVFSCLLCFKKHWRSAHIYWAPAVYQSLWQTLPRVCFAKVSVSGVSSQAVLAGGGTDQRHLSERWVYCPGEIKLQNYQSGLSNLFQLAFQIHPLRKLGWGWEDPPPPLSKVYANMLPLGRKAATASGPGWCPGLATELPVVSQRGPRAHSSLPRRRCFVVQSECTPPPPPWHPHLPGPVGFRLVFTVSG